LQDRCRELETELAELNLEMEELTSALIRVEADAAASAEEKARLRSEYEARLMDVSAQMSNLQRQLKGQVSREKEHHRLVERMFMRIAQRVVVVVVQSAAEGCVCTDEQPAAAAQGTGERSVTGQEQLVRICVYRLDCWAAQRSTAEGCVCADGQLAAAAEGAGEGRGTAQSACICLAT
jgi:chromosome segregation ATPase